METSIAGNARPTIHFSGPLDDDNCIELIDRIRVLRDDLFYSEVQLRLASPGGQLSALKYFADSLRGLQAGGLTIFTHAITKVGSAAAVLLSLGDVRTAHRKSLLLYHTGRVPGMGGAITAKSAESLATALTSADDEIVSLLVDRAALSPPPEADTPPDLFALWDWQVIGRLSPGNARKPETKLRRFRRRVAEAFKTPAKLGKLYSEFCTLDAPISPYLARELGLIDRVGDGNSDTQEQGAATDDGGLAVPEWAALYTTGRVPRAALTRHTLVLGESGSGKTVSGVLPILSALAREGSPVSCALVIDPKWELLPVVRGLAGADCSVRVVRAGVDSVNVMAGARSVAEDVSNGQWMAAAGKILARTAGFADSPGRIFAGKPTSSARNAFWENEGARLAQCVLAFTLLISRSGLLAKLQSNTEDLCQETRDKLADFGKFAGLGDDTGAPAFNVVAIAHRALGELFVTSRRSSMPAMVVIEALRKQGTADDDTDAIHKEVSYWDGVSGAVNQYVGVLGEARVCLAAFADPAPAKSLFFGVEKVKATVDFTSDVGADTVATGRSIYVYQPALSSEDALVAKCLKGAFFESVLASPDRRDRGAKMPLAIYIADEFHRFVTSDDAHGEQSFLDTARSFGAACVLATQSDASLRHALALAGEPAPDTAIRIILTNTATKLVFRSSEHGVRYLLDGICPGSGPHRVTAIRPPSTLRPGECYASLPDGRFERRQLKPFEPPKRVIERTGLAVDPNAGMKQSTKGLKR